MERVHTDILGPFSITKKGNKYLLTIIDQFTKWLEGLPLSTKTADVVANNLIDNFFSCLGCPLELNTNERKNYAMIGNYQFG